MGGHSLTYVAEQAGHSIATLARHYEGTMRELETKPRVPAAEAIRQARAEVCGTHGGRTLGILTDRNWTHSLQIRYGRCWARTSDLRLVEAALSQLS